MKHSLIALSAITLLAAPAFAEDDSSKDRNDTFASLDSDSDGKLSKEEVDGSSSLSANFSMIDRNSDGYISRGEFRRNTMRKPKRNY